ncbi:MAG: methyl-accepting chemotaxis protein [candidate division Zixibacteria bacterium]|nr:methyl-accepting chemotaxis protein [candidate division Zixibacteria bacterium]MDD5427247.1 methyl-accepting chemotaxis protein [candidate division Zixibacteria bacterium]
MLKWNIRNQILCSGFISLIMLVGLIVYFYNFTKSEFTKNNENLIELTGKQFADEINREFENNAKLFDTWVKDDVFGIAIEFNTTTELGVELEKWLSGNPGFALLALIDKKGQILEIAKAPRLEGNHHQLKGQLLPDFNELTGDNRKKVIFTTSKTLSQINRKYDKAYIFYQPATSTSGETNGALVAFSDWTVVNNLIEACHEVLLGYGFRDAASLLIFPRKNLITSGTSSVLAQANTIELTQYAASAQDNAVVISDFNSQSTFAGSHLLKPPSLNSQNSADLEHPVLLNLIPEDKVMAILNKQLLKIIIIGIFGSLLVLFISYTISMKISKRISQVARVAQAMATGDIDQTLSITSNDETGVLANAFGNLSTYVRDMAMAAKKIAEGDLTIEVHPRTEKDLLGSSFKNMIERLSDIIRKIKDNARGLATAGSQISSTSEHMSKGVKDQVEKINQISTAIEEMTSNIVTSSKNSGEASQVSKNASDFANTGGEIVNETIEGMQKITSVVGKSAESISKLAHSADQIGEIISVIDEIADQTNLLALNAAIEAARAGEQGRGFAVVADEVRKLAERTGKATGEITEMIKGIQNETEDAVKSMEAGVQEVDKGRVLVDKAGSNLSEIVNMSQQVSQMIQQIARASDEQSIAAEEISKNIERISEVSKETASGAEQSFKAAEELNCQAEILEEMVSHFNIKGADKR